MYDTLDGVIIYVDSITCTKTPCMHGIAMQPSKMAEDEFCAFFEVQVRGVRLNSFTRDVYKFGLLVLFHWDLPIPTMTAAWM